MKKARRLKRVLDTYDKAGSHARTHHLEEDRNGTPATGKLADMVILSDEPSAADSTKIRKMKFTACI